MKKIWCVLLFAAVLSCAFAGGNKDSKSKVGDKVVLRVIANVDNSTSDGADWQEIVKQFEADNPNIEVQDVTVYSEAYHQKARAMLASKDYPHVAYIWPDARGIYFQEAGQLVDNRPYMDKTYYDFSQIPGMGPKGEVWEVPDGAANFCSVVFMNTAILKKYGIPEPKTYADLVAMVAPLKKDGIMVISMCGSDSWVWGSCLMSGIVPRYTGQADWVSRAVKGEYKFTDPSFVKALSTITMMTKDGVLPASTMVTDYGTSLTNFITGKAAFMIDGQWRANGIEDPALQENVKMITIPALPGENVKMANSVAAAVSVGFGLTKAATEDPAILDASIKFIRAVNSPANVTRRWLNGSIVAPVEFVDPPSGMSKIVLEKMKYSKSVGPHTDVIDSYLPPTANDALNIGMQNIALGKATPESVAAEVERLVRAGN